MNILIKLKCRSSDIIVLKYGNNTNILKHITIQSVVQGTITTGIGGSVAIMKPNEDTVYSIYYIGGLIKRPSKKVRISV